MEGPDCSLFQDLSNKLLHDTIRATVSEIRQFVSKGIPICLLRGRKASENVTNQLGAYILWVPRHYNYRPISFRLGCTVGSDRPRPMLKATRKFLSATKRRFTKLIKTRTLRAYISWTVADRGLKTFLHILGILLRQLQASEATPETYGNYDNLGETPK
jgi:hypothetical protein